MDLIKSLEEKFKTIDAKLSSSTKVEAINSVYSSNVNKINKSFDSKKQKYENGLNNHRGEMLEQINQKRNKQLKQIDAFMQTAEDIKIPNSLSKLQILSVPIKAGLLSFASSLISVFESILFRFSFENNLNLCKVLNYSIFIENKNKVGLPKLEHLQNIGILGDHELHVLPLGKMLICSYIFAPVNVQHEVEEAEVTLPHESSEDESDSSDDDDDYETVEEYLKEIIIVILNKTGDVAHLKKIKLEKNDGFDLKINATNIFCLENSNFQIYNFNLELVHSFNLQTTNSDFEVNDYAIAFYEHGSSSISLINYKTKALKKEQVLIDKFTLAKFWLPLVSDEHIKDFKMEFMGFSNNHFLVRMRTPGEMCAFVLDRSGKCFLKIPESQGVFAPYLINRDLCIRTYSFVQKLFTMRSVELDDPNLRFDSVIESRITHYLYLTSNKKIIYARGKYYDEHLKQDFFTFEAY